MGCYILFSLYSVVIAIMAEAHNSMNGAAGAPPAEDSGTADKAPEEPGVSRGPQEEVLDCPVSSTDDGHGEGEGDEKESQDGDTDQSEGESDPEEGPPEILDANQLEERLGEARKAVVCGRYEEATQLLPSCLATITGEAGELCVKLAEPHYLYGKSLFECARVGAGVIGEGVLKENPDKSKGEESSEDQTESTDEVNETEPNSFEVAWENLEVSRVICSKHLEQNSDISVAKILLEVLTCLGELQVETGCYEKAAADYTDCLRLVNKYPGACTQQVLGATHFSLGLAYSLAGEHQLAAEALKNALDILTKLLGELQEGSPEASSLQELIDEIKPRLAEAIDQAREKIEQLKLQQSQSDQPTSSSNGEKQSIVVPPCEPVESVKVNDISHLVRKKRPLEEVTECASGTTSPKKAKSEPEVCPDET